MKIAIGQLNYKVGDIEQNLQKITDCCLKAIDSQVDLLVFSELALLGYPPKDLLSYKYYEKVQKTALEKLLPLSTQCDIVVGGICPNDKEYGNPYYNCAFFLSEGKIKNTIFKTLLPSYDVFDETRFFEPNQTFECIQSGQIKIALTICEDIWDNTEFKKYELAPLVKLNKQSPDLIINISASPFHSLKIKDRIELLRSKTKEFQLPAIYVNQVGAQTELIFDGNSFALNKDGSIAAKCLAFEEDFKILDFEHQILSDTQAKQQTKNISNPIESIHKALIRGIKDYFQKNGFQKAVLGSSGGIDSALVQTLAVQALGAENVFALLMPSPFSSNHSVADAEQLCKNLGNPYAIAPISNLYTSALQSMENIYGPTDFSLTEENIQSRLRAVLLMAYSNKKGNLLLNTSNKSELAVGYGTLYGDMCGAVSVIGDLYKTQVYELANFINIENGVIPESILTKEPSAELRPDQKDSDSLPDYEVLDTILKFYIEEGKSPSELTDFGLNQKIVNQVLRLVHANEYKRFQAPPVLRVSQKAFGLGRNIPLTAKYPT
jgi:NAD+ synthase (glutamine-hydrolysing)